MDHDQIKIEFNDDRSAVKLTLLTADGLSHAIEMRADQLLQLVQGLGKAHQLMIEGKEPPRLKGAPVEAILNTRWAVAPELMGEVSLLNFFHPAYGPLGFLLSMDQVAKMVSALSAQLELAKSLKKTRQ